MNDIKKRTPIADYDDQRETDTDDEDEICDSKIPNSSSSSITSESGKKLISSVWFTRNGLFSNLNNKQLVNKGLVTTTLVVITVTIIISIIMYYTKPNDHVESYEDRSIELLNYFRNQERFPSQDSNLWFGVTGALEVIPEKPSVFLLTHNNDNTTSVCMAELIANAVNRFFFKGNKKWILLNGSSISRNIKDHGEILKEVKDKIKSHHILVVNDLQDISSNLIRAFHFILDQENPIAQKAVYILVIDVNKSVSKNPAEAASNTMMRLWNDLHHDVLYPLITRITLTTLAIAKEENIEECFLRSKNTLVLNDVLMT